MQLRYTLRDTIPSLRSNLAGDSGKAENESEGTAAATRRERESRFKSGNIFCPFVKLMGRATYEA